MSQACQLCTFHVGKDLFGVRVTQVQEVILHQRMTPVPLAPRVVRGLINLRGQIVTAVDMRSRLGLGPLEDGRASMNVVVRVGEAPVSLLVDDIGDVLAVDDASFDQVPETLDSATRQLVAGVYKVRGALLLALDPARAVAFEHEEREVTPA
jgi:purine-binding chemotaxis protein CheW